MLGESRQTGASGRQQTGMRHGKCVGHHRDLRPDHLFMGVARELGRAESFPVEKGTGATLPKYSWHLRAA